MASGNSETSGIGLFAVAFAGAARGLSAVRDALMFGVTFTGAGGGSIGTGAGGGLDSGICCCGLTCGSGGTWEAGAATVCCITTAVGGGDVRPSPHQRHAPESPATHSTAATAHLQARTADPA